MLRLIRMARRRLLANELFSQGVNASAAALAAFILLLLAGTDLLQWQWLLLLPAAAAAIGLFAALKRRPAAYTTAQMIDRRMGLADTLSTAWFFSRTGAPREPDVMLRGQQEQAERLAENLDVRQAVPLRLPRRAYAVAALALLASSLFALRYGITRRLDLHPPLARLLEQQFGYKQKAVMAKNSRRQVAGRPDDSNEDQAAPDAAEKQQAAASADAEKENADDNASSQKESGKRGDKQMQADNAQPQDDADDAAEAADSPENPADSRSGNQADQQGNRQSDQSPPGAQQDTSASNESSSLLSKMKDALDNLLSRIKPPQSNAGSQSGADQNGRRPGQDRQNGRQQPSAKNGQRGNDGQKGDSQDAGDQSQGDASPDMQGDATAKDGGPSGGKQPGSGIGNQDGDKTIKQAEQLAAMGKISEIIGKRSANLTGEATAEVQSTSQQLRTPYAQRAAQHTQAGGEISRDEIPVALEGYVEKYFEQLRKQTAK